MTEYIDPDNILGNNIVESFSVPHKCQLFLGSLRVIIKHNTVKPTNIWHNLYTLVMFIAATFSEWCYQKQYFDLFYHRNLIMYWTCFFGTGSVYVSYIFCITVARFTKRDENLKIYTVLQKINRLLDLHSDYHFTRHLVKVQKILAMVIFIFFTSGITMHSIPLMDQPLESVFLVPALLTTYIDIHLCGSLLYFLAIRLYVFNTMLKNHISKVQTDGEPESVRGLSMIYGLFLPSYDRVESEVEVNRWIECVREMLKVYKMIATIFSFQMFHLAVIEVFWTFISISVMVVGLRSGLHPLISTVMVGIWTFSYFVLLIAITLLNHWILYEIKETKKLCVRVMSYDNDDAYHKTASEILRIIHYTNPKFEVYGIFSVTASLPLTIVGVITSNVLVCVQFIVDQDK